MISLVVVPGLRKSSDRESRQPANPRHTSACIEIGDYCTDHFVPGYANNAEVIGEMVSAWFRPFYALAVMPLKGFDNDDDELFSRSGG